MGTKAEDVTPEEARALWIEALRSGRFKQGKGRLARVEEAGVEYCCLGVGCEVYIEQGRGLRKKLSGGGYLYGDCGGTLPEIVRDWLGLEDSTGTLVDRKRNLAGRNDSGATFEEIALLIENGRVALAEKE